MDGGRRTSFRPEHFGIGRLFLHVRDAVVVANAKSERIVLWNDCAGTLFGYTQEEALDLPLHTLVPDDLRSRHRAGIARYQDLGTGPLVAGGAPVELRGLHRDGHEVPIELTLTAVPERTAEGDRFVLAIIRDISDRKRAEEAARAEAAAAQRRRQALELNDEIVQGLTVAKLALETGETERGIEALGDTLRRAQNIVSMLLQDLGENDSLTRGTPAHTPRAAREEDT